MLIKDCKLHASATVDTPQATGIRQSSWFAAKRRRWLCIVALCLRRNRNNRNRNHPCGRRARYRTGQTQSRKIVTTANAQWLRPFRAEPYAVWNATTAGNVTVTIYGTINSGTLPNNDDVWAEFEFVSSSGALLGTIVTTTKASVLASNAAVASDDQPGGGGGSALAGSPFKLTATLSSPQPGMAGYIHARIRAAKASTTFYIDRKFT